MRIQLIPSAVIASLVVSTAFIIGARGASPATTPQAALTLRSKAAADVEAWLARRREGGEAQTPAFTELYFDAKRRVLSASLEMLPDPNAREQALKRNVDELAPFTEVIWQVRAQDVTATQRLQANFELHLATNRYERSKRREGAWEASESNAPPQRAAAARVAAAEAVLAVFVQMTRDKAPLDLGFIAGHVDAVMNVLDAQLDGSQNQSQRLSFAQAAKGHLVELTRIDTAAASTGQPYSLPEYAVRNIEWMIAKFESGETATARPTMDGVTEEVVADAEDVEKMFDRREEGGEAMTPSWLMLRSRWLRRLFETRMGASANIEAQMSAAERYYSEAVRRLDKVAGIKDGDASLARAIWSYHVTDARCEMARLGLNDRDR